MRAHDRHPPRSLFEVAYGRFCHWCLQHQQPGASDGVVPGQTSSPRRRSSSRFRAVLGSTRTSACSRRSSVRRRRCFPEAIFAVHLDHGRSGDCFWNAVQSGFYSSVMIDASHEPYEKKRGDHEEGSWMLRMRAGSAVEGRDRAAGRGGGGRAGRRGQNACLTNPEEAQTFREGFGVWDSLACCDRGRATVPTSFRANQGLRFDVLAEIQKTAAGFPVGDCTGRARYRKKRSRASNAAGGEIRGFEGAWMRTSFVVLPSWGLPRSNNRHRRAAGVGRGCTGSSSRSILRSSIFGRQARSS